jgi:hypothetical protein
MPFRSKAQARLCYALKKWNCDEWSKQTDWKNIPEKLSHKKSGTKKSGSKKSGSKKYGTKKSGTKKSVTKKSGR